MSSPSVTLHHLTLEAHEQKSALDGVPDRPDRPIGFARIVLDLENLQPAAPEVFTIQKLEIRDAVTEQVQMVSQAPYRIRLQPMERSMRDFDLTNQTGYGGNDRVKVVLTYQLNGQTQVKESAAVKVDRF